MRRLAADLAGDASAADDLVQDAWFKLAGGTGSERPSRAFVQGLLRRLAWRRWRGERRRRVRECLAARPEGLPSTADLAERIEVHEQLIAAVKRLSDPVRTTLMLRYYGDLTAAEIARRQGIPAATVRARIQRGLAKLRAELDERAGGRESWMAALAPWVGGHEVAVAGAVLIGAIMMKAIASIAVAAVVVGLWVWSGRDEVTPTRTLPVAAQGDVQVSNSAHDSVAVAPAAERVALDGVVEIEGEAQDEVTVNGIAIGPLARVELRVLDLARRPIEGARVETYGGRSETGNWRTYETLRTDAAGRVAFECPTRHFVEQAWWIIGVEVVAEGFARGKRSLQVEPGGTNWFGDILLEPGTTLHGQVVDSSGLPFGGARVEAVRTYNATSDGYAPSEDTLEKTGHTETAADGSFLLEGIPLGDTLVRARTALRGWTLSPVLALRAGEVIDEFILELRDAEPERWIRGRLLGPDGEPVLTGLLLYRPMGTMGGLLWSGEYSRIRAEGWFEMGPLDSPVYEISRAACNGFARLELDEISSGTHKLVIELKRPEGIEVRAISQLGVPIESARTVVLDARNPAGLPPHEAVRMKKPLENQGADDEGVCRVGVPPHSFRIQVEAPGFKAIQLGPFDPATGPRTHTLRLERGPAIRGRVIAGGKASVGVKVSLRRAVRDGGVRISPQWIGSGEPFESLSQQAVWRQEFVTGFTDINGRFTLPIEPVSAGRPGELWYLLAESDEHASALMGPMEIDNSAGIEGLRIELTGGGAVEGELRLHAGLEPAGSTVHIGSLHGERHSQNLGPDGKFRFDRLCPGPWQMALYPAGTARRPSGFDAELPGPSQRRAADFQIAEGELAHTILDLTKRVAVFVEGELRIAGRSQENWTARWTRIEPWHAGLFGLNSDGSPALTGGVSPRVSFVDDDSGQWLCFTPRSAKSELDADGRFEQALEQAGEFWLVLTDKRGSYPFLNVSERVELRAPRDRWSAEVGLAKLSGVLELSDPGGRPRRRTVVHRVVGPGTRVVQVEIQLRLDGGFDPVWVGAGRGVIYARRKDERLGWIPDLGAPLLELELETGEERVLH